MHALRELQRAMAAAILRRDAPPAVPGGLRPDDQRLARRLAVYRVNARENFAAALEAAFPVLRHQLGAEEFRSLAWSYQQRHPSRAGNLFEAGRALPAFLARHLAGTAEAWQADLAALEWAVQEALVAADTTATFDPARLAGIPASAHADLRFELHPAVRRVRCDWTVLATWQAVANGDGEPPRPSRGREVLLVHREPAGVRVRRLDAGADAVLAGLLRGESLGELADAATTGAPDAKLGAVLADWAAAGIVTGVTAPPGGGDRP